MGLLRYNTHAYDSQQNYGPDSLVQRMGGLGLTDEEMLDTKSTNMVDRGIWRLWRQGQSLADILVQCHERNFMVDEDWLEECLGRVSSTFNPQRQYAAREPSTQEEPHVPLPAPWSDPSSNEDNDNDDSASDSDETIVPHNHNLSEDQDPSGSGSGAPPASLQAEVKVWEYRRLGYSIQEIHDAFKDEGHTVELDWISEVLDRRLSGSMLEARLRLEAVYPEGRELGGLRTEIFERFGAGFSVEEIDAFLIGRGYYVDLEWLSVACYVHVGDDEEENELFW